MSNPQISFLDFEEESLRQDSLHKQLRSEVSGHYAKVFIQVGRRDGFSCSMCGKPSRDLQIDHIAPISLLSDRDSIENLRLCCRDCNLRKGSKVLPGTSLRKHWENETKLLAAFISSKLKASNKFNYRDEMDFAAWISSAAKVTAIYFPEQKKEFLSSLGSPVPLSIIEDASAYFTGDKTAVLVRFFNPLPPATLRLLVAKGLWVSVSLEEKALNVDRAPVGVPGWEDSLRGIADEAFNWLSQLPVEVGRDCQLVSCLCAEIEVQQ